MSKADSKRSRKHSQSANGNSRYRATKPTKPSGVPHGWMQSTGRGITREYIFSLLDSASAHPVYDGNEELWDRVLELLNLRLNFQPVIAQVLSENRWRSVENPKAYVARAAYTQALSARLIDRVDKGLKVFTGGGDSGEVDHMPDISVDEHGNDIPISEDELFDNRMFKFNPPEIMDDERESIVPAWLQDPLDDKRVNWFTVAEHATRKRRMVPALGMALTWRFQEGMSRDAALRKAAEWGQRRGVEAAWKWIDRNFEARVAPVFRKEPPQISPPIGQASQSVAPTQPRPESDFLPPWEALRNSLKRKAPKQRDYVPAPSLDQAADLPITLPPGVSLYWTIGGYGVAATLRDKTTGKEETAYGDDRSDVLEIVEEIISDWKEYGSSLDGRRLGDTPDPR